LETPNISYEDVSKTKTHSKTALESPLSLSSHILWRQNNNTCAPCIVGKNKATEPAAT